MFSKTKDLKSEIYIVAIGASAGGMEAINLLFDHTPEFGVAYVIIQHLSPDYESFMAELLAKHSKLKILVAEENMSIHANCIYLMPRGKYMTINNRALHLTDILPKKANKAIDMFLDSLANDAGEKSVAVILSGAGSDGAKGITSIKNNNGLVIVQDPVTAKFDSMPNSAIETGNVDIVRPPELIPYAIVSHLNQRILENNFIDNLREKDDAELSKILTKIQGNTPFDFSEYKRTEVDRNLKNTTYSTSDIESQLVNLNLSSKHQKDVLKNNLTEFARNTLLEESSYQAAIWVDTDFEIIKTSGNFEKFLLPKIFIFNLLNMLPKELAIATSTTLKKAVRNDQKTIIENVKFTRDNVVRSVNVLIKPYLSINESDKDVVLILFSEDEQKKQSESDVEVFKIVEHTERYYEDMKIEFAETKDKLNKAVDAFEVCKNNMSSYIKELISGNEELQSANEELQKANIEHQLKIKDLTEFVDELNNYFKSTMIAQLYVDSDCILRKFTPSAVLQINLKDNDLGRPISDITTNIEFSTLMDDIAKVIDTAESVKKEIQTLDDKWYQMAGVPYIKKEGKKLDGAIITFNDITEQKKVQAKLSRINQDHDTFIYSVSHDLKGPLNNLKSLITILEDSLEITSEEDREIMGMINQSTINLGSIINELSDIVKIENEIDVLENIDVAQMIEEIQSCMQDKLILSKATIKLDLKVAKIPFSRKNLRSILTNLLTNAIKYSSPDRTPEVTFSTENKDNWIVLSAKDNGMGIRENKKQEIFARFKRAHNHVEGTGVGLFLVKKIINLAGGDIEVESELGKGSTFRVYFKCSDQG